MPRIAPGIPTTQASAYDRSRTGRRMQEFRRSADAVGIPSPLILAWRQGPGPGNDRVFRNGLGRDVRKMGRAIIGDAGFDRRGVTERDGIHPIRRDGRRVDPKRKARAEWVAATRWDGG
ncbi:hypothetical protein [Thermoflexus sp.]|uniref:hypothetical protein n=1 Tax=Thermoflexus sp. TaxID=1969742 RepID=UPI0035E41B61